MHAGEPGAGIPAVRARIEEAWGARAYDHAGMTEMGAYGFECAAQSGLHVNEAEFIAEVIDPATGAPADEGELVLTNLGRLGSPLLRYRTGDRVRAARTPCACGRTFLRLEGGILGRVDDMLIVRGVNVFPSALEGIVRRFPDVDEFVIEVYRRGQLDEVRLLLEVNGHAQARWSRRCRRRCGWTWASASRPCRCPGRACRATSSRPGAWCVARASSQLLYARDPRPGCVDRPSAGW